MGMGMNFMGMEWGRGWYPLPCHSLVASEDAKHWPKATKK